MSCCPWMNSTHNTSNAGLNHAVNPTVTNMHPPLPQSDGPSQNLQSGQANPVHFQLRFTNTPQSLSEVLGSGSGCHLM